MQTYFHRPSRPAKRRYLSRHAMRLGAIALGLILLVDMITIRYFPQAQSALTPLPQQSYAANKSAFQFRATTNGASATATTLPMLKNLAQDTFARPDQSLWGTASDGQMWSADAAQSPAFSIVNHIGVVSNGNGIYDTILGPRATASQVLFSGSVSNFAASNMGILLRWTNSNNLYKVFIDSSALIALKKVNGVVTVLQTVPFTAHDGVSYTIRAQAVGTSIMARAWPTNQAEPSNWMLTVSDGDLASGFDGLRLIEQHGVMIAITSFLELQV